MKKLFLLLTVSLLVTVSVQAQEAEEEPSTLNEKYYFLKKKSNTWENFKVIREYSLDAFWKEVQDSVRTLKTNLEQANQKIGEQQVVVDQHQSEVGDLKSKLAESESRNDSVAFLGAYIPVDTYNSIVWGIIGSLLVVFAIGFIKFRSNEKLAQKKSKDFDEVSAEFEEYRKIVRQREIRIKRELQTASNKLEEIKHRVVK